ncbi:unnamed protein product [Withania somnifera]
MRGVIRFGRHGKLSPRYIGPYEILERVGDVAYRLALPPMLSVVHPVFHVSMLRWSKEIPVVKVRWSHRSIKEATWEIESEMRKRYP